MTDAVCMRCGRVHPRYRFAKGQLCYLLWCESCGTQMHEPRTTSTQAKPPDEAAAKLPKGDKETT